MANSQIKESTSGGRPGLPNCPPTKRTHDSVTERPLSVGNSVPCPSIRRELRQGLVIWFSGLSGAGKSTMARLLISVLRENGMAAVLLDGDELRSGVTANLRFDLTGRIENVRRAAEIAKLLSLQGVMVVAALSTPTRETEAIARRVLQGLPLGYVYVSCSLEECERRDTKGIYALARDGQMTNVAGMDLPFDPPRDPDLIIDTEHHGVRQCHEEIIEFFTKLKSKPISYAEPLRDAT